MKRLLLIAAVFIPALFWRAAHADEVKVGSACGVNIVTFNGAMDAGGTGSGAKLAFQARDGGCVYYRAGCPTRADGGVTCTVDAGPGDPRICFGNNSDPYKVDMPAGFDRLFFRGDDNTVSSCTDVYQRRP